MKLEIKYFLLVIATVLFVSFLMQLTVDGNYINRPFSECEQNFTIDYGAFQSCGKLMSDNTARIGLLSIFIGLPLLSFVILPLLVLMKKKRREVNLKRTREKDEK